MNQASYHSQNWRQKIYVIIEGTDTTFGKLFDVALLCLICLSVLVVMLDSVLVLSHQYGHVFNVLEWMFTGLFAIEYGLRVFSAPNRRKYLLSFFGAVDFLSLLPGVLTLFLLAIQYGYVDFQYLLIVRVLRLLRVFRILRLIPYLDQAGFLLNALYASRFKITVFFIALLILVTILGSIIYMVEGAEHGFTSIPVSIYWAIVTLTTVGYGDISPKTPFGQAIASVIMITGYSIIAVPTGLFTMQISKKLQAQLKSMPCKHCGTAAHVENANFCAICGQRLKA